MYTWPKDFSPDIFIGKKLESILFTENTVNFSFESFISINVRSSFRYRLPNGNIEKTRVPCVSSSVMALIGRAVVNTRIKGEDLHLEFSNKQVLEIISDTKEYECFIVTINDKEIII